MSVEVDTIIEPLLGIYPDYQEGRLLIGDVVPGSSAAGAGLQAGDEILRVGHVEVTGEDWAPRFRRVYADSAGVPFTVEFLRNGERMTGAATIRTRTRVEYRIEAQAAAGASELAIRRGLIEGVTR